MGRGPFISNYERYVHFKLCLIKGRFLSIPMESAGIPEFRSITVDSVGISGIPVNSSGIRRNMWGNKKYWFFLSFCVIMYPRKSLLYSQLFWPLCEKRSLYWPLLTSQNYWYFFMEFWSIHAFPDIYFEFRKVNM